MYRHLNVKRNIDLIDLHRFKLTTDTKRRATIFEFYSGDRWVPLTKQTGEFFAPKTLRDSFGEIKAMKNFLGIKTAPPSLEPLISAAIKFKAELTTNLQMKSIPLKGLASLAEDIHVKTRKALQNTDLDMQEFLGIDSDLQGVQGELLNNNSKLTEIDKRIKRDTKKLEEVENGSSYTDEQRQLYRDRLDDLNIEKQERSSNQKDLQTQVARIKQIIEKVLDKETSLAQMIRVLFKEQGITIFSILTVFSMTISTIILSITGVFGRSEGGGQGVLHQKMRGS